MKRNFGWFPVTLERPDRGLLYILNAAFYDDAESEVGVEDDYQVRYFGVGEVSSLSANEMRFINEYGEHFILRATLPDDSTSWTSGPRIPLPVEIIGAIMSNTTTDPTLAAAVDNDGEVHTVVLETGLGLYARYARNWLRITDLGPLDQLNMVSIPETDLEHYDLADEQGHTVNIADLSPIETTEDSIDLTSNPTPTPVTAAGSLTILSAADLPAAIEHATNHEDARWYVERRAKALGWQEALPWA